MLALIASVSITFVNTLPATLVLDDGGALNVLLFGLTVLALAWFGPSLSSEVVQGQPHLSGSDAIRTAVGAGFSTVGAGFIAYQGAKNTLKLGGAMLGGAGRLIGGRRPAPGSGSGSGNGGGQRAINYAAMQPRPSQNNPKPNGGKP